MSEDIATYVAHGPIKTGRDFDFIKKCLLRIEKVVNHVADQCEKQEGQNDLIICDMAVYTAIEEKASLDEMLQPEIMLNNPGFRGLKFMGFDVCYDSDQVGLRFTTIKEYTEYVNKKHPNLAEVG